MIILQEVIPVKGYPVKSKPVSNSLILGGNAYFPFGRRHGHRHNCNLAVIGATDRHFQALVNANLRQGSSNYVVLTSSEDAYQESSAVLIDQGYNVIAYDLRTAITIKDNPASLLNQSLATAIFFLFDLENPASHIRVSNTLTHMFHCLSIMRSSASGTGCPAHIQFFLDDIDVLSAIPGLTRALSVAYGCGFGIVFSISNSHKLRRVYPGTADEILDCCDLNLLYGKAIPAPNLFSWTFLRSILQTISADKCELHVKYHPPRRIIPLSGRSETFLCVRHGN